MIWTPVLPTGYTADSAADLAGKTNVAVAVSIYAQYWIAGKVTTCHT